MFVSSSEFLSQAFMKVAILVNIILIIFIFVSVYDTAWMVRRYFINDDHYEVNCTNASILFNS